jgi:hypothetical protein
MLRGRAGVPALVPSVEPVGLTPLIDVGDAVPLVRHALRSRTTASANRVELRWAQSPVGTNFMRYHIQQGERADGHLRFMYRPAIETLKGLENHTFTLSNTIDVNAIPPSSTFVWVGIHGVHRVPWKVLRSRGVKTVYYQTEPVGSCFMTSDKVDEIWDYSWFNIKGCEKNVKAPILRYVPIAAQNWAPTVVPNPHRNMIEFFGSPRLRSRCYKIDRSWKQKSTYDVWDEAAFKKYMLKSSGIFISIHKGCLRKGPVSSFRDSLLLSTNSVVISERCHEMDEKMYNGMILFVDNVANISQSLVERHLKVRDMDYFRKQFSATAILEAAGLSHKV